jgi:co-chaperonin GroES (HSP10)
MPSAGTFLKPANRYMLIVPHFRKAKKTSSGVLLPDEYKQEESRYIKATVVAIADDCSAQFQSLKRNSHDENKIVVIDSSMVEEVKFDNKKNYLILENYVIGILRESNEKF